MSLSPRILIFTGDGKGKTTAALGMALRAAGHGIRTFVLQFIKADEDVGELPVLSGLRRIEVLQTGLGFLPKPTEPSWLRHQAAAEAGLLKAKEIMTDTQYGLVILDEICVAVARGLLKEDAVIAAVRQAHPGNRIVLTGRGATAGLIAMADTVTDMQCVKHAFQNGIPAQKGVER